MKKNIKLILFVFVAIVSIFTTTNVFAKEVTITSNMSLEEMNSVIENGDIVTVESGNYEVLAENGQNYHKSIVVSGKEITVKLSGEYQRFQMILKENATINLELTGNTTLNGEASTVFNPAAAIAIQSGEVNIDTNDFILTISDYNNAIRMGLHNNQTTATLNLLAGAKVLLEKSSMMSGFTKENAYYDSYNDHGDVGVAYGWTDNGSAVAEGSRGSAIYTRGKATTSNINLLENATLTIKESENSGIYVGYNNTSSNTVNINLTNATLVSDYNKGSGIFEDGANTGNYHITAKNSDLSFSNNNSRGMVGHNISSIYLEGSTLHVDNNKSIGINNAFITLKNSTLTGNNNGGHGITNVSLDAYDSIVEVNNNLYIGLNITKYNQGQTATNIVNTKLTTIDNKGSGVRFYANRKDGNKTVADVIIKDGSIVTAKGNGKGSDNIVETQVVINGVEKTTYTGYGTALYGYQAYSCAKTEEGYCVELKTKDSGYWADIVSRSSLSATESSIFVGTYSLYDANSLKLQSILYVNKDMIVTTDKNDEHEISLDIYNDKAASVDGRTVVVSGSLQGNLFDMTNGQEYLLNGVVVAGDYAAPINYNGTKLLRFDLNKEINKEVSSDGTNTFTYYDPYTGEEYVYSFRYNKNGEDLIEGEGNNAYIWTPASIVHYDATEGLIDYDYTDEKSNEVHSTAGEVVNGSSITNQENNTLSDRFSEDITVFGNSLNLAEKVMPSAHREGYEFLGWYLPAFENWEEAARLAKLENPTDEDWQKLYDLLTIKFDETSKVAQDALSANLGVENITIYAKWALLGNLTVRYVDEDGNKLHDDITSTKTVGTSYETEEKAFENYELIKIEGEKTGTYKAEDTVVTYIYAKKTGTVIAHYVDEEGVTLHEDIKTTGKVGESYETELLEIEKYVFLKLEGETSGNYIDGTIEVTYIYTNKTGDTGTPIEPVEPEQPTEPEEPITPPHTGVEFTTLPTLNGMNFVVIPKEDKKKRH